MSDVRTLLTGLAMGESPRWHAGRLWASNWGAQEIVAVDVDGRSEVMARLPSYPFSIDWLHDGRLLITNDRALLRREADGTLVKHVDLTDQCDHPWNEIVVDGRGNIYVNNIGFDFPGEKFAPGIISLVSAEGSVRQVAGDLAFPNGMVITPDNKTLIVAESFAGNLTAFDIAADGSLSNRRVWAALGGPGNGDGITLDADGAVWTSGSQDGNPVCLRVREGGQVVQRIEVDGACFACMLGGDDEATLFMIVADWNLAESIDVNLDRLLNGPRTGRVLVAAAPAERAGWP